MWRHLWNLLSQAWSGVEATLSTSTTSIILFMVAAPVVTFFVTVVYSYKSSSTRGSFTTHAKDAVIPTLIGLFVPSMLLGFVFCYRVIVSVYDDHMHLVAENRELRQPPHLEVERRSAVIEELSAAQIRAMALKNPPYIPSNSQRGRLSRIGPTKKENSEFSC
jgi:hypothetical protein